jgi:uncharacterized Zn-finger protein
MPDMPSPAPTETIMVHDRVAACDGGGGTLGHPKVYLRLVDGQVICPYCSRHFVLAADAPAGSAH